MILKSKAKSQSSWREEDPYGHYEQFRPEWFNFQTRPDEKAANAHLYKEKEPVIEVHSVRDEGRQAYRSFSVSSKHTKARRSYFQDNFSFLTTFKSQWIDEELFFAMNKLSLLGLVITLMFLGTLFFLSGFLMAVNLYGIGDSKGHAQMASMNPSHMPTPGYVQGHHHPTVVKGNHGTVAPGYATMGGVAMIPQPRLPSNIQNKKTNHGAYPPQGPVVAAPVYPTQQYVQHNPYPPQMPINQNMNGYAAYPAHVPAVAAPGYNPAYAGAQPPMIVPTSAPVYRGPY
ncbi:MAG: hypothetical protein K2Q34_02390 [Alphaproteobacteria bacterium]|nr:hypothetical protein [Alphaproteobacteria bacterium]